MITLILTFSLLCGLCWIGFTITGAILGMIFWVCVKLPLAIFFGSLGLALCLTIFLFPLGKGCFDIAGDILF